MTRLAAVEALSRVDVVCTDKTGTLTEGHLAVSLIADADQQTGPLSGELTGGLRRVLLTAAIASPSPDASDAASHPTDVAVVRGAEEVGLGEELRMEREAETPFDPVRAFHATVAGDHLCVKGAPEVLIRRCDRVRREGEERPLDEAGRRELLATARHLAERGLRVLAVAEGSPGDPTDDPQNLVALGFWASATRRGPRCPPRYTDVGRRGSA